MPGRPPRILTLGGHDFRRDPADEALNDYIVSLPGVAAPRICLLPTASGDAGEQITRFNRAFADRDAIPSVLSLFRLSERPVSVAERLLSQDIIYVAGGSMLNMFAVWRVHRLEKILLQAWREGVVICGHSAGAMCWFDIGVTKSAGRPARAEGLGLLPGSACVHYHSQPDRRSFFRAAVQAALPNGLGLDDHAGVLWQGGELAEAISAKPGAGVYAVQRREGVSAVSADETPLECRELERVEQEVAPEIREYRRHSRLLRQAGRG
jgi:dipeptidase E